ncbi:hypothetical protein ACFXTI_014343 [Malus domestica]
MIDMCCEFEHSFKRDSENENAITRKRLHKKERKSKETCFHCGNDERWKKKYRRLTRSRTLRNEEMIMQVRSGTKIYAKAVGTYLLKLPSREVWNLNIVYIFLHV